MFKHFYHPKAFLLHRRNTKNGLTTRTKVASLLEKKSLTAKMLSQEIGISYSTILHHLHLLENENAVIRQGRRPFFWKLTGLGQKRLIEI